MGKNPELIFASLQKPVQLASNMFLSLNVLPIPESNFAQQKKILFKHFEVSLTIDGLYNDELKIKGIETKDLKSGEWQRLPGEKKQENEGWGEK